MSYVSGSAVALAPEVPDVAEPVSDKCLEGRVESL